MSRYQVQLDYLDSSQWKNETFPIRFTSRKTTTEEQLREVIVAQLKSLGKVSEITFVQVGLIDTNRQALLWHETYRASV